MLSYIGNHKLVNTDLIGELRLEADSKWEILLIIKGNNVPIVLFESKEKSEATKKFNEILTELRGVGCLINLCD